MKKSANNFFDIIIRYFILILVALPNLFLFYAIFTPITIYSVYFLFEIFFDVTLFGNIIFIKFFRIELIEACIAGAAYYLLFILNLATPGIKTGKRIKLILFSFLTFLIINILRIFFLGLMFLAGSSLFDITHQIFWYLGSTLFVVLIWFAEVKLFKIKQIPFYSDLKYLLQESKLTKNFNNSKSSKKN